MGVIGIMIHSPSVKCWALLGAKDACSRHSWWWATFPDAPSLVPHIQGGVKRSRLPKERVRYNRGTQKWFVDIFQVKKTGVISFSPLPGSEKQKQPSYLCSPDGDYNLTQCCNFATALSCKQPQWTGLKVESSKVFCPCQPPASTATGEEMLRHQNKATCTET